jgi:putative endonuclease
VTSARQRLGRAGEVVAGRVLVTRGYRIIARNVRADRVEMDLIARRGPLLIFVEVKSRSSLRAGSAAEAVDARKQNRLRRGAMAWLATKPAEARGTRRTRFDVVTCLRVTDDGAASETAPTPKSAPATAPFGSGAPPQTTAPEGARWWIEHWEAAF